jgi:hypothetical protein
VERQQRADRCLVGVGGPPLREIGEVTRRMVVKAPDPGIGAEVVVEGTVLLHQEDDVLDGADVTARRLDRPRRLDRALCRLPSAQCTTHRHRPGGRAHPR